MTFYGDGLICDIKLQDKNFMSGTKEDAYLMVFIRIALPQIGENLVLRYGTSISTTTRVRMSRKFPVIRNCLAPKLIVSIATFPL